MSMSDQHKYTVLVVVNTENISQTIAIRNFVMHNRQHKHLGGVHYQHVLWTQNDEQHTVSCIHNDVVSIKRTM